MTVDNKNVHTQHIRYFMFLKHILYIVDNTKGQLPTEKK